MKREDILDSLEYLDEELIREADQTRNAEMSAGNHDQIIPLKRKRTAAARWGTLAAGFTVLIISFAALAGILRVKSGSMAPVQSIESTEAAAGEDNDGEQYGQTEAVMTEPETENMPAATPEAAADVPPEEVVSGKNMKADSLKAEESEAAAEPAEQPVKIRVLSDAGEVIFALNGTPPADSLAGQLPLHAETEPYGANEIVFHPEKPLNTENGAEGGGSAGYLGYFEPWNNIVMYYGDFDEYPGLYILGEAVSGAENIKNIRGGITIERIP